MLSIAMLMISFTDIDVLNGNYSISFGDAERDDFEKEAICPRPPSSEGPPWASAPQLPDAEGLGSGTNLQGGTVQMSDFAPGHS